jgi:hypothetical protein
MVIECQPHAKKYFEATTEKSIVQHKHDVAHKAKPINIAKDKNQQVT